MPDNRGAGQYDRRITILKPVTIVDDFNQEKTGEPEVVYSGFPAHRLDSTSTQDEKQTGNRVGGEATIEWRLRWIPGLDIRTDWQLIDNHDGKKYAIIQPSTEIGRREAIRVLTKIVQ